MDIICGNSLTELRKLESESVQCCVTSPPYWGLRDYGREGQLGLEKTPEEYVGRLVLVFREVRRALRKDGVCFLNLGDSYAGSNSDISRAKGIVPGLKPKDLVGVPWRVAFALQGDGWWLRQDIIWAKPNPMPESVRDRCTKAHEYIFMLTKSAKYYYDAEAIKESAIYFDDDRKSSALPGHKSNPAEKINGIRPIYKDARSYDGKHSDKQRGHGRRHAGFNDRWDSLAKIEQFSAMRNKRDVWTIATKPFKGAHFATFPPEIPRLCILAGSRIGDTILDPFMGSGTTGMVAKELGREFIGIELNPEYITMSERRIASASYQRDIFDQPEPARKD